MLRILIAFLLGAALTSAAFLFGARDEARLERDAARAIAGRESAPEPRRAPVPIEDGDGFERAFALLEPPALPAGKGVIRGRIIDEEAQGVADVEICLAASLDLGAIDGPSESDSLSEYTRKVYLREARRRALTRTTRSDAKGGFRFDGLHDSYRYGIRAEKRGWIIDHGSIGAGGIGVGDIVVIKAKAGGVLMIGARDEAGRVPPRLYVNVTNGMETVNFLWTPDRPEQTTLAGAVVVTAQSGDHRVSPRIATTLGPEPTTLQIVVEPVPTVHMRLTSQGLREDAAMRYLTLRLEDGETATAAAIRERGRPQSPVELGGSTFKLPETGRYGFLGITMDGSRALTEVVSVEILPGENEVVIPALELIREDMIQVRAHGPDDRALKEFEATAVARFDDGSLSETGQRFVDGEGRIWIAFPSPGAPGARPLVSWVHVRSKEHGDLLVAAPPGSREIVARFAPPVTARLTIGEGIPGTPSELTLAVYPESLAGLRRPSGWTRLDRDETFRIESVQPGRHALRLRLRMNQGWVDLGRHVVDLGLGDNEVEFPAPTFHSLRVRVRNGGDGDVVILSTPEFGTELQGFVNEDGLALFRYLLAGEYDVGIVRLAGGTVHRTVRVPDEAEIELTR
ncbi:MAG: hypothetical protein R3F20_06880 [Planctomycetota bacterium]